MTLGQLSIATMIAVVSDRFLPDEDAALNSARSLAHEFGWLLNSQVDVDDPWETSIWIKAAFDGDEAAQAQLGKMSYRGRCDH